MGLQPQAEGAVPWQRSVLRFVTTPSKSQHKALLGWFQNGLDADATHPHLVSIGTRCVLAYSGMTLMLYLHGKDNARRNAKRARNACASKRDLKRPKRRFDEDDVLPSSNDQQSTTPRKRSKTQFVAKDVDSNSPSAGAGKSNSHVRLNKNLEDSSEEDNILKDPKTQSKTKDPEKTNTSADQAAADKVEKISDETLNNNGVQKEPITNQIPGRGRGGRGFRGRWQNGASRGNFRSNSRVGPRSFPRGGPRGGSRGGFARGYGGWNPNWQGGWNQGYGNNWNSFYTNHPLQPAAQVVHYHNDVYYR
ncbi:uncharacterized protein LOC122498327 [Leptopilina heterotoma]|uniref:uncharacterized protein LOC122498327 n=1 Tax=Leptopilina heterotoma TaxID=63436 RepID=UPI001CA7EF5E|nr:uncharacterized protein LOC122498327 [Leptopilina heterotoma]